MAYVPPHRRQKAEEILAVTLTESESNGHSSSDSNAALLWQGLSTTGFVLVSAPDIIAPTLCEEAMAECRRLMAPDHTHVVGVQKVLNRLDKKKHRRRMNDYKDSVMLRLQHIQENTKLKQVWDVMQVIKTRILQVLEQRLREVGFGTCTDLLSVHQPETDTMRLLHYPAVEDETVADTMASGNRCYAHVDYGTITLLLSDKAGLEVEVARKKWVAVPYMPAAVAVNVGKELAHDMSQRTLKAAVHRVPGPRSSGSMLYDRSSERHAIVLFVQKELYSDGAGDGKKHKSHSAETYKKELEQEG